MSKMKKLEEYTVEELISLYKRMSIYATTWFLKYSRLYKMKEEEREEPFLIRLYNQYAEYDNRPWPILFAKDRHIEYLKMVFDQCDKNDKKWNRLRYELEAERCFAESIYWFCGGHEQYIEDSSNPKFLRIVEERGWSLPDEREVELHINDESNIEYGIATDYQVYQFIWDTLQYLNVAQLTKLLKFADKGLNNKWENIQITAGRKSKVCEIQQIDIESGEVICVYKTRNELMEKTGIIKSHLSQCIKTAKDNPNNRLVWKKWKGNDGKLYGFVEAQ